MANEKIVVLEHLNKVKRYIDAKDGDALKAVSYADNTLKFFNTKDGSGAPAVTVDLPEEMVLDLTKTTLVNKFAWSEANYPGSTNPNLNNKPVLVLAVKTDTDPATYSYSFVAMTDLVKTFTGGTTNTAAVAVADGAINANVKVSAEEGNLLAVKTDGLFVSAPDASASISFATNAEIEALFS